MDVTPFFINNAFIISFFHFVIHLKEIGNTKRRGWDKSFLLIEKKRTIQMYILNEFVFYVANE
ncbi:hypothetical protein CIB95_14210 [Lottiidibacillus patelloidae]|uniref:Uncharacterized protein n=1 Tax=Lottiidibacillus patelloidae TaxID=2670334 RepID=A0A263BQK2_9BACI|nr:hypothetical protein CIB95_14210 [Lottiidibacillus patelloidae]